MQLGLANDKPKVTLAVKLCLACVMIKCWKHVSFWVLLSLILLQRFINRLFHVTIFILLSLSQFLFHIIIHLCIIILPSVYILIVSFCSSPLPGCCILFPQNDSWWGRDFPHSSTSIMAILHFRIFSSLFYVWRSYLPASKFDTVPSISVKYLTQILNSITSLVCRSPAPFVTTKYLLGHDPKRYKKLLL